jgi:hypothetical protein
MANQPCCTNDPHCFCIAYTNNQQESTFWCWAAVTANSHNAILPAVPIRQCDVVNAVFPTQPHGDPCQVANKGKYKVNDLGTALDDENIRDRFADSPVDYNSLVAELSGAPPEPVALQINFAGNPPPVHYIAICGVHTDTQTICVADPRYGGDPVELPFQELFSYGYQNGAPGGGNAVAVALQRVTRPLGSK